MNLQQFFKRPPRDYRVLLVHSILPEFDDCDLDILAITERLSRGGVIGTEEIGQQHSEKSLANRNAAC